MNIWAFMIGWIVTGVFIGVIDREYDLILFNIILCILVSAILFLTGLGHF